MRLLAGVTCRAYRCGPNGTTLDSARFGRRRRIASSGAQTGALLVIVLVSLAVRVGRVYASQGSAPSSVTIEGQLSTSNSNTPHLKTPSKQYQLRATKTYVLHTLQDKRLSGREIRAEGKLQPDGTFEVDKFFTLHSGKLYRVRYYCETCNIVALEPGPCECCQQPTELQEIPVGGSEQDAIVVH